MLLSKGIESVDREQVNDWQFIEKVQKAKQAIPKRVAVAWLEMSEKGCLPRWAEQQMDIGMVRKAAL